MNDFEGLSTRELSPATEGLSVADFEYLHDTEGLSSRSWEGLSPKERLETMQTLENKLAEIQGRPPVSVTAEELEGENGHYDPETHTIALSLEALSRPSKRLEVIDTIAHEGRHAYQHYAVEHPGFHDNPEEVEAWRENMENYEDGTKDGLLAYRLQPIEADAWKSGHLVRDALSFADMEDFSRYNPNA